MVERGVQAGDLAGLVVPLAGRLVATGDRWEPYRLLDGEGVSVVAAAAYFSHLQAAGRPETTVRSYGMDLLRWFRFVWAAGVGWDRAARADARDFCRWLQVAGKPVRPHWRARGQVLGQLASGVSGPGSGEPGRHAAGLALLLDWMTAWSRTAHPGSRAGAHRRPWRQQ